MLFILLAIFQAAEEISLVKVFVHGVSMWLPLAPMNTQSVSTSSIKRKGSTGSPVAVVIDRPLGGLTYSNRFERFTLFKPPALPGVSDSPDRASSATLALNSAEKFRLFDIENNPPSLRTTA